MSPRDSRINPKFFRAGRLKLILAILWLGLTVSMVTWWWIFSMRQLNEFSAYLPLGEYERFHRMIFWEGSIFVVLIFGAGSYLLILTHREHQRNLSLRLFFSNFSHDLKTSLSRLRLRAEVLNQNKQDAKLEKLLEEVQRLDLQLENSLWVARGEEQKLLLQDLSLAKVVSSLRVEWPDLEVSLQKDARVRADLPALKSVFRNIFQNSWLHGQATHVEIAVEEPRPGAIEVSISDNGLGGEAEDLKEKTLALLPLHGVKSHGLGLHLTQSLLKRMNGGIDFVESKEGFQVRIQLQGALEQSL